MTVKRPAETERYRLRQTRCLTTTQPQQHSVHQAIHLALEGCTKRLSAPHCSGHGATSLVHVGIVSSLIWGAQRMWG